MLFIVFMIYFVFGPGSRLLKKKSHHYTIPPAAQDDPNWIPIDINDYVKHIYLTQNTEEDTPEEITKIVHSQFPEIKFNLTFLNGRFQLAVTHSSFSDFHHLIALCAFINGQNVVGYCKHKTSSSKDYIVKMDLYTGMEHLIGCFRTDENFVIYLPKSDENLEGNISKSPVTQINFQKEWNQIPSF